MFWKRCWGGAKVVVMAGAVLVLERRCSLQWCGIGAEAVLKWW